MTRNAWIACGLVLVSRILAWWLVPYATEDALITFRVARNWLEHGFPSYNVGEHVGSVTSLPWTAWVSLGLFAQQDPVLWTRCTGLACDALVLWLVPRGTLPVFALIYSLPIFSYASVSGMETPAVTAALIAGARSPWGAGVLACLRPEGLFAAAVMLCRWCWLRFAGVVLGGATVVLSLALWGDAFPTAQVKATVYGLNWFRGWLWLSPVAPLDLGGSPVGMLGTLDGLRLIAVPLIAVGATFGGVWRLWVPALAWLLTYYVTGTSGFWWYAVPCYAALGLVAAKGLDNLKLPWIFQVVTIMVLLSSWWPGFNAVRRTAVSEEPLRQAAAYLIEQKAKGSILLEPAGHIGWANPGLRVIDEVGLVTPWVAKERTGLPGWWSRVIKQEQPEWVVVRQEFLVNPFQAWAGIGQPVAPGEQPATNYAPVKGFGNLVILKRQ